MHVRCYNIKFAEKASEISVTGANALEMFMWKAQMNSVGEGQPYMRFADRFTEDGDVEDVEVDLPNDWLDDLDSTEFRIKQALEKKTGFKVKEFNYIVRG